MRLLRPLLLLPLLAACAAVPQPQSRPPASTQPAARPAVTAIPPTRAVRPPAAGFRSAQVQQIPGLETVLEHDAASLARLLGAPRLDVRDGDAQKLQFAGAACVLDVYLYPLEQGAAPVATHVEARRASDGAEVDRAACVQALSAR
jgi:hypothetical protein